MSATQLESLDDFQLNTHMLSNIREAFPNTLYHRMDANGTHFELIK